MGRIMENLPQMLHELNIEDVRPKNHPHVGKYTIHGAFVSTGKAMAPPSGVFSPGLSDARQDCSLWSPLLHFAWEVGMKQTRITITIMLAKGNMNNDCLKH